VETTIPISTTMTTTTATTSTTETVAGVWKRLWEEDPIGDTEGADLDTLVLWTQSPTSGIYVDIRLPLGSPGRSEACAKAAGYEPRPEALEGVGMTHHPAHTKNPLSAEGQEGIHSSSSQAVQDLALFYQQKSFAGVLQHTLGDTTATGDALRIDKELARLASEAESPQMALAGALPLCTCFWRREVDYQPPTGGLDIGVCASGRTNVDGSVDLRETGDDGSYTEGWHRLPLSGGTGAVGPFLALQLISENGIERMGYWVRTGKYFAYCVGRPHDAESAVALGCHQNSAMIKNCVGKSLKEAIATTTALADNGDGEDDDDTIRGQLAILGSYVAVAGEIEDHETAEESNQSLAQSAASSSSSWMIKHSTDPGLVGCHLVGASMTPLCCSTLTIKGDDATSNSLTYDDDDVINSYKNLMVGDILLQVISGARKKIRGWRVVEMDGNCDLPIMTTNMM
jgi:hypothetical protein